jgi:DNA primase
MEVEPVLRAVTQAARVTAGASQGPDAARAVSPARGGAPARRHEGDNGAQGGPGLGGVPRIDPRDPVARVEREALECLLQVPRLVPLEEADGLGETAFEVPAYRAIHLAIRAAGGIAAARSLSGPGWMEAVLEEAPQAVHPLVTELAVTPLPAHTDDALTRYAVSVVLRLAEVEVSRRVGVLRSRMQRLDPTDPAAGAAFAELLAVEAQRRSLRERISGG